jgi:hypothetical protein
MSKRFHIAVYSALIAFAAFMVLVNYGLQAVNDHLVGKCVATYSRGIEA